MFRGLMRLCCPPTASFSATVSTKIDVPTFGRRRRQRLEQEAAVLVSAAEERLQPMHIDVEEAAWATVSSDYNFDLKPPQHTWRTFLRELRTYKARWRLVSNSRQSMTYELRDEIGGERVLYYHADCSRIPSLSLVLSSLFQHWHAPDQTMTSVVKFANEVTRGVDDMVVSTTKGHTQILLPGREAPVCEMSLAGMTHMQLEAVLVVLTEKTFGFPNYELCTKEQMGQIHQMWAIMRAKARLRPMALPIAEYQVRA